MRNIGVLYEVENRTYDFAGCIDGRVIVAELSELKTATSRKERRLVIHQVLESEVDQILSPDIKKSIEFVMTMRDIVDGKGAPPLSHVKRQLEKTIMRPNEVIPETTIPLEAFEQSVAPKEEKPEQTDLWSQL